MSITIIIIRNRKQELELKGISQTLGRDASRVKADEEEEPSRRGLSYLGKHKALQRNDTETPDNAKRKLTQRVPMFHCQFRDLEAGDKW